MGESPAVGRWTKRILGAGLAGGAAYALWRYRANALRTTDGPGWEAAPFPFPPVPTAHRAPTAEPARIAEPSHHPHVPPGVEVGGGPESDDGTSGLEPWMEPIDGACPLSHPVKAKLSSGIYHVPGGLNYERTKPDRCYVDAAAAEADGLRPSQR